MLVYGVVGKPVSHSLSPQIMNAAFSDAGIDAFYTRFLLSDVSDFSSFVKDFDPKGLSITAPFKKAVLNHVDRPDADVSFLGAANTLVFNGIEIAAYNTDVSGVIDPIRKVSETLNDKKVLVIGAGGAARAVLYAFRSETVELSLTNRSIHKIPDLQKSFSFTFIPFEKLSEQIASFDVIVNTLPVRPESFNNFQLHKNQLILDASYKNAPLKTLAFQAGSNYLNGSSWLLAQAKFAFHHFTGIWPNEKVMLEAIKNGSKPCRKDVSKLILTGPMGAGKSTLAKALAEKLDFEFVDLDTVIENKSGRSIDQLFKEGENVFREFESKCLREVMERDKIVLACGGGVVLKTENRELIQQGQVVFLYISPETTIERNNSAVRPLLKTDDPLASARKIMKERFPLYIQSADLVVRAQDKSISELLTLVYEDYRATFCS